MDRRTGIFLAAAIGISVVVVVPVVYLSLRQPGIIDFLLHRTRYNTLLRAIKSLPLRPGESRSFGIDNRYDPSTLVPMTGFSQAFGKELNVQRDQNGNYRLDLLTRNDGHAGFSGYVYLDVVPRNNEAPPEPPQEPRNQYRRMDAHWWAFYNNEG